MTTTYNIQSDGLGDYPTIDQALAAIAAGLNSMSLPNDTYELLLVDGYASTVNQPWRTDPAGTTGLYVCQQTTFTITNPLIDATIVIRGSAGFPAIRSSDPILVVLDMALNPGVRLQVEVRNVILAGGDPVFEGELVEHRFIDVLTDHPAGGTLVRGSSIEIIRVTPTAGVPVDVDCTLGDPTVASTFGLVVHTSRIGTVSSNCPASITDCLDIDLGIARYEEVGGYTYPDARSAIRRIGSVVDRIRFHSLNDGFPVMTIRDGGLYRRLFIEDSVADPLILIEDLGYRWVVIERCLLRGTGTGILIDGVLGEVTINDNLFFGLINGVRNKATQQNERPLIRLERNRMLGPPDSVLYRRRCWVGEIPEDLICNSGEIFVDAFCSSSSSSSSSSSASSQSSHLSSSSSSSSKSSSSSSSSQSSSSSSQSSSSSSQSSSSSSQSSSSSSSQSSSSSSQSSSSSSQSSSSSSQSSSSSSTSSLSSSSSSGSSSSSSQSSSSSSTSSLSSSSQSSSSSSQSSSSSSQSSSSSSRSSSSSSQSSSSSSQSSSSSSQSSSSSSQSSSSSSQSSSSSSQSSSSSSRSSSSSSSQSSSSSSRSSSQSSSGLIPPLVCDDPVATPTTGNAGGFTFTTTVVGDVTTLDSFVAGSCNDGGGTYEYGTDISVALEAGCCYQFDYNLSFTIGEVSCSPTNSFSEMHITGVFVDCQNLTSADDSTTGGRNTTLSLNGTAFACGPGPVDILLNYANDASGACSCPDVLSASGSVVITKLGSCGPAGCSDDPVWTVESNVGGGTFSSTVGTLQYDFADSVNCGGSNSNVQTGVACMVVDGAAGGKVVSVSGNIEHHTAGFDCITVKIDGVQVLNICSNGDSANCSMESRTGSVAIPSGPGHVIEVTISTVDAQFHQGAFWQAVVI
jgi:hypothetical protein